MNATTSSTSIGCRYKDSIHTKIPRSDHQNPISSQDLGFSAPGQSATPSSLPVHNSPVARSGGDRTVLIVKMMLIRGGGAIPKKSSLPSKAQCRI